MEFFSNHHVIIHYRHLTSWWPWLCFAGKFLDAIKDYRQIVKLLPSMAGVRCNLGVLFETVGEYSKAEAQYVKAAALPDSGVAPLNSLCQMALHKVCAVLVVRATLPRYTFTNTCFYSEHLSLWVCVPFMPARPFLCIPSSPVGFWVDGCPDGRQAWEAW